MNDIQFQQCLHKYLLDMFGKERCQFRSKFLFGNSHMMVVVQQGNKDHLMPIKKCSLHHKHNVLMNLLFHHQEYGYLLDKVCILFHGGLHKCLLGKVNKV